MRFKTIFIFMSLLILAMTGFLWSLSQNIHLFFTPSQLLSQSGSHMISKQALIRVGGSVVPNSLIRDPMAPTHLQFQISEAISESQQSPENITVEYHGILPDLFRDSQMIVALGYYEAAQKKILAKQILTRHDENYRPPVV
jgi:cytochrome c-type biogenesis protein CcmE